jgi:hypothetical protein
VQTLSKASLAWMPAACVQWQTNACVHFYWRLFSRISEICKVSLHEQD